MLNGEVALITGAARGQGRSHAIRLAEASARIVAVDICHDIPVVPYGLSSWHDMEETVELVKRAGGEVAAFEADVRDVASMQDAIDAGTTALGGTSTLLSPTPESPRAPSLCGRSARKSPMRRSRSTSAASG